MSQRLWYRGGFRKKTKRDADRVGGGIGYKNSKGNRADP